MKYTEKDLYKGMKLRCVSTVEPNWWNVGKQYEVEKRTDGLFILKDETGYIWNRWLILDFLNGKAHCKMEIVEEEKEMKYTENDIKVGTKLRCTKAKPEWWTVGKDYDVTFNNNYDTLQIADDNGQYAYADYMVDCLNGKHEPVTFEIVEEEKEVPTLKANVNVDVKEAIQDKIDELRTEAEHLFKKRDRLEQHGINLNKKAQKLKEVLETIKEFE